MEFLIRDFGCRQRGLSLLYAMLALAALGLASIALMRAVSTSSMVSGNLSFQQDATVASDQAVRQAIGMLYAKISVNQSGLDNDLAAIGYYASTDELVDVTGSQLSIATRKLVRWSGSYCGEQISGSYASCDLVPYSIPAEINGNRASFVIFRLCNATGDSTAVAINCARPLSASVVSATNEARDYAGGRGASSSVVSPYYRIVVRVSGARNTTSYTETIVHF